MCGIAGYATREPAAKPDSIIRRMADRIHHRGPDETGFYSDAHISLGHLRLSIIDLSTGQQPMANEDGSLRIIYNGEIFNHKDLRGPLEAAGHVYHSRSDTETILHSYEQHGADCVTHFRGMFAFALWDIQRRRLFCARDRLGIKPFYYYWDGETFVFASEIKALLVHPRISAALEPACLPEYLAFGYTNGEQTMFRGIRKLMPGHTLTLDLSAATPKLQIERYWNVPEPPANPESRSDQSWIDECRQRLEETVRMRLMSDVPLGMFLSGGVDSSAIAALMKRMTNSPVKTFSVGYQEAEFSELSYARQVAQAIGTDHHEVKVSMADFFGALPKLVWHEDEPITWPSSISLYFVAKLAAQQVKVVLTGEGSDELFAGYARYHHYESAQSWLGLWRTLPGGIRTGIRNFVGTSNLLRASLRRKLQHTFVGRGENLESLYLDNFYGAYSPQTLTRLFHVPGIEDRYDGYMRQWSSRQSGSLLSRMLFADQKTYLVELLMKQDQMSMACSIESRVPFLDHPLVEFSTRVPDHMKIRGNTAKYIFKKAVEDLLPHDIIYRPKMGFPTPLRSWLMSPAAEPIFSAISSNDGPLAEYIDPSALKTLLERQRNGLDDATDPIWRLLNLRIWSKIFLEGDEEMAAGGSFGEKIALAR
jgi:asparagine synthase (glutamine-hydrolysing)